jgi:hypothetical protein
MHSYGLTWNLAGGCMKAEELQWGAAHLVFIVLMLALGE